MIRYGLTASKKVGNAPTRNRARRRLRAAARLMFPGRGVPADIVLIARQSIATASWGEILDDIRHALEKLERGIAMNNGQA
jgi:ribonuclease P protein component